MSAVDIVKGIGGLLFFGAGIIIVVFTNFVLRRSNAPLAGIPIPASTVHAILGPLLVLINAALLVLLCALFRTDIDDQARLDIQKCEVKWVLGPLLNPFYLSESPTASAVGYAFLIVLWWLGMHAFAYSVAENPGSRWLYGWQILVSVLYLALGLAAMAFIQSGWNKLGMDDYRLKWRCGFIGIPIGVFIPPILLRLGLPRFF